MSTEEKAKTEQASEAKKAQAKKTRRLVVGAVIVLILALMMPISNLIVKPDRKPAAEEKMKDAMFARVGTMLVDKCSDCHSSETAHPWYFSMPIAKTVISKDVEGGIEALDMSKTLFTDEADFSQIELAKIEYVMVAGTMPPMRYVSMHWDARASDADRKGVDGWIRDVRAKRWASPNVAPEFAGEVIQPIPLTIDLDAKVVALGDKLFHDKRLSADDTLACAGCHGLDKGGTDQAKTSTGVREQIGPISAPTVYNASYNHLQFWDGRAADLFEQADGPVNNPIEMASNWEQVIPKIQDDPYYKQAFGELYAGEMTEKNIRQAIATFEKSLITPNSAFDKYLMGDANAVSEQQLRGYHTYVAVGCGSCHMGVAAGGLHFEKMGKKADYFKARGSEIIEADMGRFNVTKEEADRHCLKVPILRNIEVTFPYLHDGSSETLADAVDKMAIFQLGTKLPKTQVTDIEAFLLALTGEYKGVPLTEVKAVE